MKRLSLGSLIVLVLLSLAAYAQTFRGAINGTVTDPSGAVVSGATVKATNTATGVPISATTTMTSRDIDLISTIAPLYSLFFFSL